MLFEKYLKRQFAFNLFLFVVDSFLHFLPKSGRVCVVENPRNILLSNGAHAGDVIISTTAISIIKHAFPGAKIGVLVGSWSRFLVEDHPMVDIVHVVDHWRLNRGAGGIARKIFGYLRTRRIALREIKREKYDLAIDLYTCFPNTIPLLWQAGIPVRVGYVSSGFGRMLTCGQVFPGRSRHESEYQTELLLQIGVPTDLVQGGLPVLNAGDDGAAELCELLGVQELNAVSYIVVHPGAGAEAKKLPLSIWRELIERLPRSKESRIVLTGKGRGEYEEIERIIDGLDNCVNACERLTWAGFLSTVAHAERFFGVDSMAGHVSGALGTKTIVACSGIVDHRRWRPLGKQVALVRYPVPCAPCHKRDGCDDMQCINGITTEMLLSASEERAAPCE